MAFPHFDDGKKGILFFSRGRGRGHAIPDIEIVKELLEQREDVQVHFVSYGTGARTIEEFGLPLIDLGLPEMNPMTETTVLAGKLIGWLNPDLVVAHEEFGAMPAAKIFDKPTMFLTDWFVEPEKSSMQGLKFADEILFLDEPGIYEEPPWVKDKVKYLGPFVREFQYSLKDRDRARQELRIPLDATVVSVLPGGWATEARAPIADLVLEAYDRLPESPKRLIWVAGDDLELLEKKTQGRDDVILRDYDWEIDRIMVATDVAVTKATRKTSLELESLGIASVALCPGLNPIDDARALRADSLTAIPLDHAASDELFDAFCVLLQRSTNMKDQQEFITDRACTRQVAQMLSLRSDLRTS